ncbi:acyltransferase [Mucilaginibacter robiniae]|uniref:Acyltransferase n=1 Tax=Mucilaginibacter robiniae TaxID=2728022 RepID=A0A7L5DWE2_9SPHI|nr:acyltransferase [Mucilaginibacter robiniae]QJD94568.1 acyltransferase [Mucilaginibacter robiniae]
MKERFEVLDIFRGIFASLVVLFHASAFSATPLINNSFIKHSDLFVDFFFILSGFVIAYSYQYITSGHDLKRFYSKRVYRLYPLHLAVLLVFIAIELLKGAASHYVHVNKLVNESNNLYTVLTNLLLLNSVKFPFVHDVSWNIASWSISAEMISYLLFGLTVAAINRSGLAKNRNAVYILVVFIAAGLLYFFTGNFKLTYNFDYGFLRGTTGFFIGVICYNTYQATKKIQSKLSSLTYHVLEPVLFFGTLVMVYYGGIYENQGFIYEILFFANVLLFASQKGWLSKWLMKSQLLHQTGKYSYSIYMTHTLMLSLFNIVFIRVLKFPPSAYSYLIILNYLLIYFVSAWTFKNIEMRFNQVPQQKGKKVWWLW